MRVAYSKDDRQLITSFGRDSGGQCPWNGEGQVVGAYRAFWTRRRSILLGQPLPCNGGESRPDQSLFNMPGEPGGPATYPLPRSAVRTRPPLYRFRR